MNLKVSIITPSFNRADIIHETANSIFQQTYTHWEWVITDDGSTDESWELLQQYAAKDQRVKIYQRNRDPKGPCVCRNISIQHATGDYLLFLDSDDLLASFCIEQRVNTMAQYPNADFLIFPMLMFKQKPDDLKLLWNVDSNVDDIERMLISDPVCQGTGTLWKRDSFIKLGMWNEQLMLWQDIELHLRALLRDLKYAKRLDLQPDVFIRISDVSISRTGFHSLPKFMSRFQVLKETADTILSKNRLNQYKDGLKYMFIDIFINGVNSNYQEQVQEMLILQEKWKLFTDIEINRLKLFTTLNKLKLFKIPLVKKLSIKQITKGFIYKESKLNRVEYSNEIKI